MDPVSILIVEDEAIIAADLSRMVEQLGCRVIGTASTAEAAANLFSLSSPQLVIMDIHLDRSSSGIMIAKILQIMGDNLPVLFISGRSDVTAIENANLEGPCAFLAKPFLRQELASTIDALLKQRWTKSSRVKR